MKVAVLRRRWVPHGGGERFAQAFVTALAAAGHEVHLVAEAWGPRVPGVVHHRVATPPGGRTLRTLAYAWLAPRRARALGATLVHSFDRTLAQDIFRAGEGCHRQWLELRRRYQRRALAPLRDHAPFHRLVLALERRICRGGGARVVAPTAHLAAEAFRRHYAPLRAELVVLRNAVDLERYHPDVRAARRPAARATLGLGPEAFALLLAGSDFARKGLATAVGALARVARSLPTAVLLVAGEGRLDAVRALAARAGVEGRVRALGFVDDLRDVYAAADVLVLPTVYDPSANVTLEAMAMGLPVVTTRTDGSSEVAEAGASAWILARPDDVDALAAALEEAADPARRAAVGLAGRRAVEPWSWARYVEETLALYRRLGAPGPAPAVR